ncbi:MAG: FAD-dependent oxidoreductase [Verrucomicrobiota bacterium]
MNDLSSVKQLDADLIVVGGTPGGIMAAIAAARRGLSVLILERNQHVGGLPANGLGATDISTRGVAAGLFKDFTQRILRHYTETYGADSEQVEMCSDGFHFEPSVGEKVLLSMLSEHASVRVLLRRQFDALAENLEMVHGAITALSVTNLETGERETYAAPGFVDATYEGDLAAASGVPFATRREGIDDYLEPRAGVLYQPWGGTPGEGSTGEGDDVIQAYNFRLCITDRPENRVPFPKPETYQREDYASIVEDLKANRWAGEYVYEKEWDGIGRITNIVWLPNGKTDANNQHLAWVSTDLPEENYPWPEADWAWRDRFQQRLQDYTLGLFWFLQNDPEVPESFQVNAQRFGLAADEYTDNGNFPRQVYVREGRRIWGEYTFLAHDAIPTTPGGRPPVHPDSITASHYPIDSHAVRKREPGRCHLDGFLSHMTKPYTVPYGVMVPRRVDNLWVPVAISASHLGFGTLRMEPCWMAMGEAAGLAAALAQELTLPNRSVPVSHLQGALVGCGAQLIHFEGLAENDPAYAALQILGVRGAFPQWAVALDEDVPPGELEHWAQIAGVPAPASAVGLTRREALVLIGETLGLPAAVSPAQTVSA